MPADRQRRVAEAQAAKVCLSLWSLGPRLGGSSQPFPVPGEQGTRRRWGSLGRGAAGNQYGGRASEGPVTDRQACRTACE